MKEKQPKPFSEQKAEAIMADESMVKEKELSEAREEGYDLGQMAEAEIRDKEQYEEMYEGLRNDIERDHIKKGDLELLKIPSGEAFTKKLMMYVVFTS